MKHTAQLTNRSIDKLISNKDYKDGISEYIWNGFDAGATKIDISFTYNELDTVDSVIIKDNGKGINFEELENTFKCVLDSKKTTIKKCSNVHGSKGKGRFSFISFGNQAVWETICNNGDTNERFKIEIFRSTSTEFDVSDKEVTDNNTGTKVTIYGINSINTEDVKSNKFTKYFNDKFAWFLYLNKDNNYEITINGNKLDYMEFIDESLSKDVTFEIEGASFKVNFIKWVGKIKQKYYSYFINENYMQIYKKPTSFNNKNLEFPHSIYVRSNYFNDFYPIDDTKNIDANQISAFNDKNQKDKTFRILEKYLKELVISQIKHFSKSQAPLIVDELEKEGAFPKFKDSRYDLMRKDDLKEVLTEICAVQPKIFVGSIENKKSIVGFLNLLLDTDEREGIINIMDSITSLTPEERLELNDVLKKTTLSKILRTVSSIQNRLRVIEALKKLIYDETMFTNERDHIQKIIENNYWIFGEQYHLVSADVNFEKSLEKYTYLLDGYESMENYTINNPEKKRRPDIFMYRSRSVYSENSTELEENIIVELKAPRVVLTKKIYRQIEDYMLLISKEPQFNSRLRKWKFIMVSSEVNDDIEAMYKAWEIKGKRFLINSLNSFEIYAMTWDDVFKNFEINHKYILEKLEFNKVLIKDEIDNLSDEEGRALVNEITKEILELKNKI
ncbi:MAG: ATP-binding protein [Clostridium sp.]|uniref:ATP-binding protein n=1 Tax=Clostridium sp. TaxID=1506 RepID=UPI00303BCA96